MAVVSALSNEQLEGRWHHDLPWLHPEALPAIRDALRLRLRLMPYLYSAMVSAPRPPIPVLAQPTFVPFEDDSACFADADTAMFRPQPARRASRRKGAREVAVYLPRGPESWRDFLDRARLRGRSERNDPGAAGSAAAARAGRSDRRHDRQRRRLFAAARQALAGALRVFPGAGEGASRATLVEDDGISSSAPSTRLTIALSWTASHVRVAVGASGNYPLPYYRDARDPARGRDADG